MTSQDFLKYYGHYTMGDLKRFGEIRYPPPVLSKPDFVTRYKKGEFGNASPTWDTPDQLLRYGDRFPREDKVPGLFHLRSKTPGGNTHYNLSWSATIARWIEKPHRSEWYTSAMAPEDKKSFQGELLDSDTGLYLNYNLQALPMREGMAKQSLHAEGVKVRILLRKYLCPNSLDWMYTLLDRYPGHAIEFSSYSCEWGTIPGFNTVFWEVRKY